LPLGANGAQEREQQEPPHAPSVDVHRVPAGSQPPAPPALVLPHTPSSAPVAFVQSPPQQSVLPEHCSPLWPQNEEPVQMPPLQYFDAQSLFMVHGLPPVAPPPGLSGVHLPPPAPSGAHVPPQHSPFVAQARLSATHCFEAQVPPMHEKVQHSGPVVHAVAGAAQTVFDVSHCLVVVLQLPLQHSPLLAHVAAWSLQSAASARPPSMVEMNPSPAASPGPAPVSPPASLAAPGTSLMSDSLPQPANTTVASEVVDSRQTAAQGSFLMKTVPPRCARDDCVDAEGSVTECNRSVNVRVMKRVGFVGVMRRPNCRPRAWS